MTTNSNAQRVQFCVLAYLTILVAIDVAVWTWFIIHRHGPHRFPLGERVERFGDLLRFTAKHQIGKDPRMADGAHLLGTLYPKNYPPLSVLLYLFLLQACAPYALPVLLVIMLGGIAVACTLLWRRARTAPSYRWYIGAAIFVTGLFGWGTEQVVMRGNIEGVLWIPVCIGAVLFFRRRYTGAAASFAIACCVKPQAVVWLALMTRQRKYRAVVIGVLVAVMVTLGSLVVIDRNPVRAYQQITGRSTFFEDYVVSFRPTEEAKGDHSVLQSMKMVSRVVRYRGFDFPKHERLILQSSNPLAAKLYHAYLPISFLVGLFVAWKAWNKPVLNQMFALACVITVLPVIAADYTFIVLLIPMGFFILFLLEEVAEAKAQLTTAEILWFLLPFAWIMATEPLWMLHGVLKCLAVLILLGASLLIPLPSTILGISNYEGREDSSYSRV